MSKNEKPNDADAGAAFLVWYREALKAFPDGLVTQAQAAKMLAIGRMAVSRLVARGYLRAVYFPRPPELEGFTPGDDDPTWVQLVAKFGAWAGRLEFAEACYVSFADVVELWLRGTSAKRCTLAWESDIESFRSERADVKKQVAQLEESSEAQLSGQWDTPRPNRD